MNIVEVNMLLKNYFGKILYLYPLFTMALIIGASAFHQSHGQQPTLVIEDGRVVSRSGKITKQLANHTGGKQ